MSSVYVVCWIFLQTFQTYFCIQANSMNQDETAPRGTVWSNPDQTAPRGTVWSGSTLFAKMILKSEADDKADDSCFDLQFNTPGKLSQVPPRRYRLNGCDRYPELPVMVKN